MNARTHRELADFIWGICNLLRGPYKRNEYRKVILPLTVLRRFDCVLAPTKQAVLRVAKETKGQIDSVRHQKLRRASGLSFYNTSEMDFDKLLADPNLLAQNLNAYIRGFSEDVVEVMDAFGFAEHIARMDSKDRLYQVVKRFTTLDLSPERVDNMQMGYVFEELIRIGAEQANEEAGEHFTPREVIQLMVDLLLSPEMDLNKGHVVRTIYDPACGTGGMLSVAEARLRDHNSESRPMLFGQDLNDEAWAVCRADMLIKADNRADNKHNNADRIVLGDTFAEDAYQYRERGRRWTFDYMLANPPFGVEWRQQEDFIKKERDTLGWDGRFGAGTPRITDGALLFLQHMLSKLQPVKADGTGGSRIAIVFNGSPLFTGTAGSSESNIRRWIIESDWLEAVVALPDQLFYNTGISTYIWMLTNRKEPHRKGHVQLIDGRQFFTKMHKSLGEKRNELSGGHIDDLVRIHGNFTNGETRDLTDTDPVTHQPRTRPRVVSKIFPNEAFGYHKITVERPLRLNFAATPERIARIEDETTFQNLTKPKKGADEAALAEGRGRQEVIRALLEAIADTTSGEVTRDRDEFLTVLSDTRKEAGARLTAAERKAILSALSERDPTAEVCTNRRGRIEPDAELRDTESVPLGEDIDAYFEREVLPHVPDAWVDDTRTKIGYEIPFNRHFYVYEPPRPLDAIQADLQTLEHEITTMLAEVTA